MMRRDFGSFSNNHMPPGGYHHQPLSGPYAPHYYSETRRPALPALESHAMGRIAVPTVFETVEPGLADYHEYGVELGNPDLPVHEYARDITDAFQNNQAVIIVSETGGGKSTQVPQIALDSGLFDRITMTQPRRIATYSVAARLDEEIRDRIGVKNAFGLVGYQTAEKAKLDPHNRISVITDGIEAVQQLAQEPVKPRQLHIIDEVHEWNTNMEITVAVARQRMAQDKNAKFAFMSATINAPELQRYIGEATGVLPPIIEVPGRSFGLERHEEPRSTVVNEVVKWAQLIADEQNAAANNILVFLPGVREIADISDAIRAKLAGTAAARAQVVPLHARLTKAEQERVIAPSEEMKIICATNVAQTSLTVPGVRAVIDSGLARYIELDDEGVQGLGLHNISRADCDQRAGRAGRLCPGDYILTRLDDKTEFKPYIQRREFPVPEILRTDIDRTTLRFAAVGIDLGNYRLKHALDPDAVKTSQAHLRRLGALDTQNQVTERGRFMNEFPVRPTSGRMLYEARRFSPPVQAYVAAITAAIEVGGLPYFAYNAGDDWRRLTAERSSDHIAQLDIFIKSQDMNRRELAEHDLDIQSIERAREQYAKIIQRLGHEPQALLPPSQDERAAIEECIVAGMADWVYSYVGDGNYLRVAQHGQDKDEPRELSNRSVVKGKPELVAASPYRVEYVKKGEARQRHIIEAVTTIADPSVLGRVALEHCEWVEQGTTWRGGKLMSRQGLRFAGAIDVGRVREQEAAPSEHNRNVLLQSVLERPGPAQRQLREIKEMLEELQHYAAYKLPRMLTQDDLLALLERAMGKELIEQGHLDDNLRKIMELEDITLDQYLPAVERKKIMSSAIPRLELPRQTIALRYRNGHPIAQHFHIHQLETMPETVTIPDGRHVLFPYHKRYFRVDELRHEHAKVLGRA